MKSVTIAIKIISRKTVAGQLHGSHKAVERQSQTVKRQSRDSRETVARQL